MKLLHAVLPMALLAAGGILQSAEPPRFGVQGAISAPAGDLSDSSNLGLQLGGHAKWDFRYGQGLMARADLTLYGAKDGISTTAFGGGADYLYHVDQDQLGFYLLAGLTFLNYNFSGANHPDSSSGFGVDAGVGYDLDEHVGGQVRFTSHNQDGSTLSALNFGVTYTF